MNTTHKTLVIKYSSLSSYSFHFLESTKSSQYLYSRWCLPSLCL